MHFLIYNNISPRLVPLLNELQHEAIHVSKIGMSKSTDEEIFNYAKNNEMVIISADTDFGYILSEWKALKPSIILFQYISLKPSLLIKYINKVVNDYSEEIESGHIVVVEHDRIRIRALPLYQ